MKKFITLIILSTVLITLTACDKKTKSTETSTQKAENLTQEPQPQTITKQEVARIALVQAKQFIETAKTKEKVDLSEAQKAYDAAQSAYDAGQFKQAQKLAVDVRHIVEDIK